MRHTIIVDDLARALAQRSEIDLVSSAGKSVTFEVLYAEYRVYNGPSGQGKVVLASQSATDAVAAYNEMGS